VRVALSPSGLGALESEDFEMDTFLVQFGEEMADVIAIHERIDPSYIQFREIGEARDEHSEILRKFGGINIEEINSLSVESQFWVGQVSINLSSQ